MHRWLLKLPGAAALMGRRARRRRRQHLKAQIAEIERQYAPDFAAAGNDDEQYQSVVAAFFGECQIYDQELDALDWGELVRQADRFGLEVPGVARPKPQYRQLRRQ